MGEQASETGKKHICVGLLAHVDAGKTTLSEALLYRTGAVKKLGRVDHRDTFLDTFALERARGITIFSKQAMLSLSHTEVTLLDTPGHSDFYAETERALRVLDYAILIISGTDGVQAHTHTLWKLLRQMHVPTLLFINKMDLSHTDRTALLDELTTTLHTGCVDFSDPLGSSSQQEAIALCDERVLADYLDGKAITQERVTDLIVAQKLFPCFFGAALKLEGVDALLDALDRYTRMPLYGTAFAARVFKIARDEQGNRLTYLKLTGGTLSVRDTIRYGADNREEKVGQLRLYTGAKYTTLPSAEAGMVVAAIGLSQTYAGMGLGAAHEDTASAHEPVLRYRVCPPEGCDPHTLLRALRILEEQDPALRVHRNEQTGELYVQLMGEVQQDILTYLLREQHGLAVTFDEGSIVYKETIAAPVLGIGHFEPLRHYAEVQLLLEPGLRGSGIVLDSVCPTDTLAHAWQQQILHELAKKEHRGVLTGATLTDVQITLLTGRAHLKHTEGGDFREAAWRAVRQGLMGAQNVLLEPYYAYRLEVPTALFGRAAGELQRMGGQHEPPAHEGDWVILRGSVPVAALRGYHRVLAAYTGGRARLTCEVDGYRPCACAQEVIQAAEYDPDRDTDNPSGSVFCSHGAGHFVPWNEVPAHAHTDAGLCLDAPTPCPEGGTAPTRPPTAVPPSDAELRAIFERTYGPIKDRGFEAFCQSRQRSAQIEAQYLTRIREEDYLLVDGYNIIFAWEELQALATHDLDAARHALLGRLSNYRGMRKCHLILVFDAYRVKGNLGSQEKQYGVDVVYTREAQTADAYIEQLSYDLSRRHRVRVATSDGPEQAIIFGHGAERISATELLWEVEQAERQIARLIDERR